jgi:hypothetical protein
LPTAILRAVGLEGGSHGQDGARTVEDLDRRATALEQAQGETTQTLRWMVSKMVHLQAVQDEHTLRLERVETKVDKLDTRFGKVDTQLEALPRAIAEMFDASEKRTAGVMAEMIEASEMRTRKTVSDGGFREAHHGCDRRTDVTYTT